MNNIKRLILTTALTIAVAAAAFAGETPTPPCPPPDPGETPTPPCASAQLSSDDSAPGQTSTPPNPNAVTEYVAVDAAIDFVESILSLF